MTDSKNIKTVKLYHHIDRVYNELKEINIGESDSLDAETLSQFDSLHYLGNSVIESAIEKCMIKDGDKILDVGSGLGGPARIMASRTGCVVDAIELQPDFHQIATNLTERCGLADKVKHILGDFFEFEAEDNCYDVVVSWQVFLHIPERQNIFEKCFKYLKPRGLFYIEDLFMRGKFSKAEQTMLEKDIYIKSLPKIDEYQQQLENVGFKSVYVEDMTEQYTQFAEMRISKFSEELDRHKRVHGQDAAECQQYFLNSMHALFQGGNLGGTRILVQKPKEQDSL